MNQLWYASRLKFSKKEKGFQKRGMSDGFSLAGNKVIIMLV